MAEGRVTGVGGIFFKSKDPESLRRWYAEHLGFKDDKYAASLELRSNKNPEKKTSLLWSPFPETTKYFHPSQRDFMVNFTVENIEVLVAALKEAGVTVLDEIESSEYGKFVHILDLEGNKLELWEPADE
jgi:predicted enzyme related to lactoylglutathione lyase